MSALSRTIRRAPSTGSPRPRPARRRRLVLPLAGLLALAAAGCGYRLAGTGGVQSVIPPGTETIAIPLVDNETNRPEIAQRVTEALINEFVVRGRYRAVPAEKDAQVVLDGVVLSFRTNPISFSPGGRSERSEVVITARMRLVQTVPEKVLWSRDNFVFTQQYDIPTLPNEPVDQVLVATDQIARDFARAVVTAILEGF
ncbi:MAG: LPS assembly lipoprotein LptE [Acidobacteria bacterium]|jgi:hypothetical protein|nr:LPS assembly lipoprotein LptE [Acidobacteriota bacterium]